MADRQSDETALPSVNPVAAVEPQAGEAVADAVARHVQAMTEVADSDVFSLSREFYDAYKACSSLLRGEGDPLSQEELEALTGQLKVIAYHVVQLRLFSSNEELDDISTADLKYLLVPYLLAEAVAATRDMSLRLPALRQAMVYWRAFASDCQRLKVAHADDLAAVDAGSQEGSDPATKREKKIARHKRSKELDGKIAYLFSKKREAVGDDCLLGAGGSFDEDLERELILALLGRAAASAANNLASAEQELPLLEIMAARGGPGARRPEPPQPAGKPFVVRIQDKAELMKLYKEMVFQCPYALPTVTLAEAADAEMANMREREAERAERARRQQAEEDERWWSNDRVGAKEDAEDEAKTYKDRDWDDWKDEHPWGSGNKMANVG